MATLIYISPSDRRTCISLGEDKVKARKIFDMRVSEAIDFVQSQYKRFGAYQVNENEIRIEWDDYNEHYRECFYFDEDNNSTYARIG